MMRPILWLCLLMAALCAIPSQSRAANNYNPQKGLIPEIYYGQWATPSCQHPKSILTIYGNLVLEASETTNLAFPVKNTAMSDGILIAQGGDMTMFFRNIVDKRMIVGQLFEENIQEKISIKKQIEPSEKYYYRCDPIEKNWLSLTPVAINAAPKIFGLEQSCSNTTFETCRQAAFAFMDTDNDGLLNMTELQRAYTLVVFYASSIGCYFTDRFNNDVEGDKISFAEDTVQAMDRNKDYKLSLDEIIEGWDIAKLRPSIQDFLELATAIIPAAVYSTPLEQ